VREKSNLLNGFNLIWVGQLSSQIYTSFPSPQISGYFRAVPSRQEGRIAIVTNARRDAVDAMASARRVAAGQVNPVSGARRAGRTALVAYGKTVWSRHPLLVPSCRWRIRSDRIDLAIKPAVMEARRIRLQGERGISRKAIAQGMPECSGCTCMLVCASTPSLAHETAGAASTRHSLLPLRRDNVMKTSGAMRRENAKLYLNDGGARKPCNPDGAQRNPGAVSMRSGNPGLRCAPSGLRGRAV
jgi:hypothetical protein